MQQLEHLHLQHVVQTVCALEAVVLRSFGPDGGQVLFIRDTGQLMLSRSGKHILTALQLDHPLARMVVECVWKHSEVTGDGSKTFILLLASLLRGIHATACQGSVAGRGHMTRAAVQAAAARQTADGLLAFALEELVDIISVGVVPHSLALSRGDSGKRRDTEAPLSDTDACPVQRLLAPFFHTRLGRTHSQLIGRLTGDLVSLWRRPADPPSLPLRFLEENFAALHTPASGLPAGCCRLVEGQVIHRDFAVAPRPEQRPPINAVALAGAGGSLQPGLPWDGVVLRAGGPGGVRGPEAEAQAGVVEYSAWAERWLDAAIDRLRGLGVTLLLAAGKQPEAALAAARRAGIAVVECVDEEELALFAQLSGARPASDCCGAGREHVAQLAFCKPIVLGAHRYVHVAFWAPDEVRPHSLVLCGAGEGQAQQYAAAIRDALRMLLAAWEPWPPATGGDRAHDVRGAASARPRQQTPPRTGATSDGATAAAAAAASRRGGLDPCSVLPPGGDFEFLLHRALLRCGRASSPGGEGGGSGPALCRLLADALLSVPRHVHSRGPRHLLQAQRLCLRSSTPLCSGLHRGGGGGGGGGDDDDDDDDDGDGEHNVAGEQSQGGGPRAPDSGLESVFCKYQLIVAVLQCLRSVLRADAMLHVHKKPKRANASPLDTDDDDDDDDDDDER